MKQAVIDIGSNSMRLTVYETNAGSFAVLFKDKVMAGLAGYVEEGVLSREGIARACQGLLSFQAVLEALDIRRAAENGKEVVVLMELRARFDEANNIAWSKMLEEAGCKVIYGIENFKCHSKLCLITLQDKEGTHYITQVGTGNYNEKTSALYTDLSVMTASPVIGADGAAFFRNMLTDNLEGEYKALLVAPNSLKDQLCQRIDGQIAKGKEGYILDTQLRDTAKASFLQASGAYLRKEPGKLPPLDSQMEFMQTSLHRPEPIPISQERGSLLKGLLDWLKKPRAS